MIFGSPKYLAAFKYSHYAQEFAQRSVLDDEDRPLHEIHRINLDLLESDNIGRISRTWMLYDKDLWAG
jgi:hypothetical protein